MNNPAKSFWAILAMRVYDHPIQVEESIMCQVFAGQDPVRYASRTRRLRLNGQSTSIRLENAFWDILDQIAEADQMSTPAFISKLHSEVLETRGEPVNFTSLLRTACLIFIGQSDTTSHHDKTMELAAE